MLPWMKATPSGWIERKASVSALHSMRSAVGGEGASSAWTRATDAQRTIARRMEFMPRPPAHQATGRRFGSQRGHGRNGAENGQALPGADASGRGAHPGGEVGDPGPRAPGAVARARDLPSV